MEQCFQLILFSLLHLFIKKIVPVVTAGAHSVYIVIDDMQWLAKLIHSESWLQTHVWPLTLSIPWGLTLGPIVYFPYPSKINIEVLEPVYFERTGEKAANDEKWVRQCAILCKIA